MFRESKIRGLQGWDKTMTPDAREREIIEKLDVFCRQKLKNLDELPDGEGEFKDSEKDFFMSIQFLLAALAESRDREKEWVDSYSKQTQQLVDSEKQVAALEAKLAYSLGEEKRLTDQGMALAEENKRLREALGV